MARQNEKIEEEILQKNVPIFIRATRHDKRNHIVIIMTDITLT